MSHARASAGSPVYAQIVTAVRGALTAPELGQITGVGERQVYNWSTGSSIPQAESRDRLLEVYYVIQALDDVYTREGVDIWLHGRNRGLAGRRPIDLLFEGQFDTVIDEVERLKSGAM